MGEQTLLLDSSPSLRTLSQGWALSVLSLSTKMQDPCIIHNSLKVETTPKPVDG